MHFATRGALRRLAIACCALAVTTAARAATDDAWTSGPQVLATGSFTVQNLSAGGQSATLLSFAPGVHYVAASRLVVGADLQVAHISSGGSSTTAFSFLPSLGFDVVLSEVVSLIPQLELFVTTQDLGSRTLTRFGVGGFLPVVAHPAGHFFIGFGPEVLADLSASVSGSGTAAKQTSVGARTVLGAWF